MELVLLSTKCSRDKNWPVFFFKCANTPHPLPSGDSGDSNLKIITGMHVADFGLTLIEQFSNRTGTSVDDYTRKSNKWLDQWQNGKLGTGSRV